MISSAVRGVAASFLSVWLFKDVITRYACLGAHGLWDMNSIHSICSGRASSIAIILAGSIYYTWVKHIETQKPSSKTGESRRGSYASVPPEDLEAGKNTKPE